MRANLSTMKITRQDVEWYTVDLVIFVRLQFLRISRGGQIREFKNLTEKIIIIVLLKKKKNTQKLPDPQYTLTLKTLKYI